LNDLSRLPVTFGLIAACVAVYVAVALAGQGYGYPLNVGLVTQPPEVLAQGALLPAAVAGGQVWLLLSSMFLHSGFIHLALNMLSLYFLGSFVEQAFGKSRFLALYLCSGLAGGIAYLYFGAFDRPAVGASGAIFGLLGGVLGYSVRRGTFSWQNPLIRQLLILTALNLYFGFSVPNISTRRISAASSAEPHSVGSRRQPSTPARRSARRHRPSSCSAWNWSCSPCGFSSPKLCA
jgi:rhomboid protease GluP